MTKWFNCIFDELPFNVLTPLSWWFLKLSWKLFPKPSCNLFKKSLCSWSHFWDKNSKRFFLTKIGIIHHCLWNIVQDFWICLFYWTRPVYKQGYKFFLRWAKQNREKLIALFVNRSSFLIKSKQIQNSVMWFLKQWCIIFYTMFCQILHKLLSPHLLAQAAAVCLILLCVECQLFFGFYSPNCLF